MPHILLAILLLMLPGTFKAQADDRCGVNAHRQELYRSNPGLIRKQMELEKWTAQWIAENGASLSPRSVITIPVVVHIVWNQTPQNITDEQVFSQIEVLNQDFQASNTEVPGIPAIFKNLVANVEIEFCLASLDPNGNPTSGITRTFTDNPVGIGGTTAIHYTSMGGRNAWDTERYLNIWVAKFAGSVGGTASFPGEGPPEEDGLEIDYRQFGKTGLSPPYHLGRTATHEMGHYFNLEHLWGPHINDCCGNDFVDDTPPSCETYLQKCPIAPAITCTSPDMFMNYMFYTDDACMGMFTLGQKMRMLATLNGPRSGLLGSIGCQTVAVNEPKEKAEITIFQNPAVDQFSFILKSSKPFGWNAVLFDSFGKAQIRDSIIPGSLKEMDVSQLASGVYWLQLENEGNVLTKKIVVMR